MKNLWLVALLLLSGCGITQPARKRQSKLSHLDVGNTQEQVRQVLGEPDRVRASAARKDGRVIKLYEYEIYGNYTALANGLLCPITIFLSCFWEGNNGTPYWMQFVDGKLEQWGRAGDWQAEQIEQTITIREKKD